MHHAMVLEEKEHLLDREAISHVTRLYGLVMVIMNQEKKTRYKHLLGKNPRFINNMRTWGETGVVKEPKSRKSKLGKCGCEGMFIKYGLNAPSDMLRIYMPKTNTIRETRNIQWMKKIYYKEKNSPLDTTVNSFKLIIRNSKVKRLRVDRQKDSAQPMIMPANLTQGEISDPNQIPKTP